MLKQVAETLPEIDEPDFLKWMEENLAEIEELIKRNYDGIYINKKLDRKDK